jgi:SAM-dependent methyltransferase
MASRRFVQAGARVIGVDPNERLLKEAEKTCQGNFLPVLMKLDEEDSLAGLPEQKVDLIWLADVFLFYFYPMDGGKPWLPPHSLLARLSKNLTPKGKLIISQTHGVFWLAPWLGDPEHPYTVINEYTHKVYSVVPGLEEISQAISRAGLAIIDITEVNPDPSGLKADLKAYHFATNFPLWWAFTCQKL